jgi:hypothetical protein
MSTERYSVTIHRNPVAFADIEATGYAEAERITRAQFRAEGGSPEDVESVYVEYQGEQEDATE